MAWYKASGAGIPQSLKNDMDSVLNKKNNTNTTYSSNEWASNVNLMSLLPVKTSMGKGISFSDGANEVPIASGIFTITYTGRAYTDIKVVHNGTEVEKHFDNLNVYEGSYNCTTGVLTSTKDSSGNDLENPITKNIGTISINTIAGTNYISGSWKYGTDLFDDGKCKIKYRQDGTYVRPANYPDIEGLAAKLSDSDEVVYLTYDLSAGENFIGIYTVVDSGKKCYLERGHIANDNFVADYSVDLTGTISYYEDLSSSNGNIQLWRIRGNGTDHISNFRFADQKTTFLPALSQCCVERSGNLNWISTGSAQVSFPYVTSFLIRDSLTFGKNSNITSLDSLFAFATNLVSLDISDWNTSNWSVTSLASTFQNCSSLKALDLSTWDTSNWAVISLAYTWQNCRKLKELDLSTWVTSGWAVTTIAYCWSDCVSLKELDLSTWDTSGWALTTVSSSWANNISLYKLDLTGWDMSGCSASITVSNTWATCYGLVEYSGLALPVAHSYSVSTYLTVDSLVDMLTVLPTVSSKKITIGATNKAKLTAEQLAIATNKGWTVA